MQAYIVILVPKDAVASLDCVWGGGGLSLQPLQAQSLQTALACGFLDPCLSVCASSRAPGQASLPVCPCVSLPAPRLSLLIPACSLPIHACSLPAAPLLVRACSPPAGTCHLPDPPCASLPAPCSLVPAPCPSLPAPCSSVPAPCRSLPALTPAGHHGHRQSRQSRQPGDRVLRSPACRCVPSRAGRQLRSAPGRGGRWDPWAVLTGAHAEDKASQVGPARKGRPWPTGW